MARLFIVVGRSVPKGPLDVLLYNGPDGDAAFAALQEGGTTGVIAYGEIYKDPEPFTKEDFSHLVIEGERPLSPFQKFCAEHADAIKALNVANEARGADAVLLTDLQKQFEESQAALASLGTDFTNAKSALKEAEDKLAAEREAWAKESSAKAEVDRELEAAKAEIESLQAKLAAAQAKASKPKS